MPILGVIASSMKGAPGIPTIGTATDVGTGRAFNNGAATVTFTPAPGATATSFTIKAYNTSGVYQNISASGASSPITITGLASSTQYKYTVYASNGSGNSGESGFSNTVTATTVPQAPTIGTATSGDTTASVPFTANATGGSAITGFTATSSPGSITGTNTVSPITVSGLTNNTSYTFTVTATNANGTSIASAASNAVIPSIPTGFYDIASTKLGSTTNTITFSNIPSSYRSLKLIIQSKDSAGTGAFNSQKSYITFNGVTTGSYISNITENVNQVTSYTIATNNTRILVNSNNSGSSTPVFSVVEIDILDYATTNKRKPVHVAGMNGYPTLPNNYATVGIWALDNNDAISSITITIGGSTFAVNTTASLYGVQ